jgi:F-type H+-transporting ATPase subunit epsilon
MNLVILSPEAEIFSGAVKSVGLPGADGRFEILQNHAAIVSALQAGVVKVNLDNGENLRWKISGGFVEMINNEVSLLVAGVEPA